MPLTEDDCREIRSLSEELRPWMVGLRRRLHEIPEPAFQERRTAALLGQELEALGLSVRTGVGGTGIVADAEGGGRACVAVRADMDALAVTETTGAEYSSQHEGYSHCCGHDGNMAAALGAGRILLGLGRRFAGRLRLVLQPAEEAGGGALAMIRGGALEDPRPRAILAIHGWPMLPAGVMGCRSGYMMAACDAVRIRIIGRGGHGARPERANSPLPGMAAAVQALADMNTDRRVVSICVARAGRAGNVIPDEAELRGTLRSLGEDVRREARELVASDVAGACEPRGLRSEVEVREGTPAVEIPEEMYDLFRRVGSAVLGAERIVELDRPTMGSEDFSQYLSLVPGLIFRAGVGTDRAPLHNGAFDFNDDVLAPAAAVLAGMAVAVARGAAQIG